MQYLFCLKTDFSSKKYLYTIFVNLREGWIYLNNNNNAIDKTDWMLSGVMKKKWNSSTSSSMSLIEYGTTSPPRKIVKAFIF